MRHVGSGEVILVHLLLELFHGCIDKECGVTAASAAPDYVWWEAIVPGFGFCNGAGGFVSEGEVSADVVEALR